MRNRGIVLAKIKVYDLEQAEEWKKILTRFPKADIYYSPEYTKGFAENGDGEPLLLHYTGDRLQALNVVMKRPVPLPENLNPADEELKDYVDYVTPYGYGGFLLEGECSEAELQQLQKVYADFCRDHKVVAEFVRFHPVLNNAHEVEKLYEVIDLGNTICMDLTSPEIIWQNLSSKNRNMIRKAQKSGVQVYWGREPALFEAFEDIYRETMDKVGARDYYYFKKEFYDSILYDMKQQAMIFYARLEGQTIAASIILYDGNALQYHLSASRRDYQSYAPTNLILYEAACWGSVLGAKTFHLGGGLGSSHDDLYHFKKQFNRNADCTFSIGRVKMNEAVYDRLWELNNHKKETGYFPAYRA